MLLESVTKESEIQHKVYRILEEAGGRMPERELCRKANWTRYGTTFWGVAYGGLLKAKVIREEGTGKPGSPKIVQLLTKIVHEDRRSRIDHVASDATSNPDATSKPLLMYGIT